MRSVPSVPFTVAALAAALLLTACDSGGAGEGDAGGDGGGRTTRAAAAACAADGIAVEVGPANAAPVAGDTGNLPVTLTNEGSECILDGFPVVKFSAGGEKVAVPVDEAAKAQKLTLAEGAAASFTLTYVRGEEGAAGSLAVEALEIALPGAAEGGSHPWSYGPVAGGEAAPEASVGAFQQAGD
jgi:hypothetical protein